MIKNTNGYMDTLNNEVAERLTKQKDNSKGNNQQRKI